MASPTVSSPAQKPNEMTSCEYASCVDGIGVERAARSAREARDGEVEAVPEEVHRARLAIEPAAELFEGGSVQSRMRPKRSIASRSHDACSTSCGNGVVIGTPNGCSMISTSVPSSASLAWRRPSKSATGIPSPSSKARLRPSAVCTRQGVVEEVKPDLEGRPAMMQAPCRKSADVDVEGCVPPVVLRRRRGKPDLADDLRVQVQRVLRRAPLSQVQLGERHGFVTTMRDVVEIAPAPVLPGPRRSGRSDVLSCGRGRRRGGSVTLIRSEATLRPPRLIGARPRGSARALAFGHGKHPPRVPPRPRSRSERVAVPDSGRPRAPSHPGHRRSSRS